MGQVPGVPNVPENKPPSPLQKGEAAAAESSSEPASVTSKGTIQSLLSNIHQLSEQNVRTFLQSYTFGSNLNDDAQALNIILAMNDVSLGNLATEVLVALRSLFSISDSQIDIQLVTMVARLTSLQESGKLSDIASQDLALAVKDLAKSQNQDMRQLVSRTDAANISATEALANAQADSKLAELMALQQTAAEPFTEHVSPSVPLAVSSGIEHSDAFSDTAKSNVAQSADRSVRVDARQSIIGLHAEAGAISAHMAGVVNQGEFSQVGLVDLNGVPMLVMTPFVAALVANIKTVYPKRNIYKVAIVCDSVACLEGIESSDSIYIVDVRKDVSTETFVSVYSDLLEKGYHRILSIHVSPLLDKTYRVAKEAASLMEDAEISVINSHANGLGLGVLIREVKEAIDHHYSPIEIGQLIKFCVKKMYQWLVPLVFDYDRNRLWLEETVDNRVRMKLKVFGFKPVITLESDHIRLVESFYNEDRALEKVLHLVDSENQRRPKRLRRIGIEYRGHIAYRQALSLKNKLQVKHPRVPVSLHVAGSVTVSKFGTELIGVCVI